MLALPFALLLIAQGARMSGEYRGQPQAIHLLPEPKLLAAFSPPDAPPLWHFVLGFEAACADPCLQALNQLHRHRVSLGRHSRSTEIVGLHQGELSQQQIEALKTQAPSIRLQRTALDQWQQLQSAAATEVWLVNPAGYLVAELPADADPATVFKDLRRLIR